MLHEQAGWDLSFGDEDWLGLSSVYDAGNLKVCFNTLGLDSFSCLTMGSPSLVGAEVRDRKLRL